MPGFLWQLAPRSFFVSGRSTLGSLFAQALLLQTVQIPASSLGFASVLNKSLHGKLASGFEGLAIGKKNLFSVLNSNHLEAQGQIFPLDNGQRNR